MIEEVGTVNLQLIVLDGAGKAADDGIAVVLVGLVSVLLFDSACAVADRPALVDAHASLLEDTEDVESLVGLRGDDAVAVYAQ